MMHWKKIIFPLAVISLITASCQKDIDQVADDNGLRPVTASSNKYLNKVYAYAPAPGQFINESIGTTAGANALTGGLGNLVTLGGYGGYIVVGFDHSIVNNAGNEIAVYGNPIIGAGAEWSEPGIVQVMKDDNRNGLPDDTWYELAGSEHGGAGAISEYKVTYYNPRGTFDVPWKDNKGNTGSVRINSYHNHNYYPLFASNQDSLVFTGTLLKSTFIDGPIAVNQPLAWGYVDNGSVDVAGQADPPRYNALDISNATDKLGVKVNLPFIDFVRIYTAQNHPGNLQVGEISTEVSGVRDMNMR